MASTVYFKMTINMKVHRKNTKILFDIAGVSWKAAMFSPLCSFRVYSLHQILKSFSTFTGKQGAEEEVKEEIKEERDPPATHEEGSCLIFILYFYIFSSFLF